MYYNRNLVVILLISFLTFGCSHTPTQELTQYRNAFSQVQVVSEEILIDFSDAKERAEKREAFKKAQASGPPILFSTELTDDVEDTIDVRRNALRVIDKYNNVLVTLAEGKSVETVQSAAGGLMNAMDSFITATAGSAVPGFSAVVDSVKLFFGYLEKARLREEFEKAVRGGTPVVNKILIELRNERQEHLNFRVVEANSAHIIILKGIGTEVKYVKHLFELSTAPSKANPINSIKKKLDKALKPAAIALPFKYPIKLSYGVGGDKFTKEQKLLAELSIERIKGYVDEFKANVEQFESLKSALTNYGAMLKKTQSALALLVEALDKPQQFEELSDEFFEIAFTVKRDMAAFRAARKY